jgi:hypothetical protein
LSLRAAVAGEPRIADISPQKAKTGFSGGPTSPASRVILPQKAKTGLSGEPVIAVIGKPKSHHS